MILDEGKAAAIPDFHTDTRTIPYWFGRDGDLKFMNPANKIRSVALNWVAIFEGYAQYHPTAVGRWLKGMYRRPVSEHTLYNKNVLAHYSFHRTLSFMFPEHVHTFDTVMAELGLDPFGPETQNLTHPAGIGVAGAMAAIEHFKRDKWNQLGDEDGIKANFKNYSDYTGYQPVNTHVTLKDPDRWQPNTVYDKVSRYTAQTFIVPQAARHKPLNGLDVSMLRFPHPTGEWKTDQPGYMDKTDEVIEVQKSLTDHQKMVAEHFEEKLKLDPAMAHYLRHAFNHSIDAYLQVSAMANSALVDAVAAAWASKTRYDGVRPFSSIRLLYGDNKIRGWGGPGKGTIRLTGREWRSYLVTDAHPEYPSATSCFCHAFVAALRAYNLGNDSLYNYTVTYEPGSSVIEPGHTPASTVVLGPYETLTQFSTECGMSRLYAGVHFRNAIDASAVTCGQIGEAAYRKMMKLISGNSDD
jgi:hypothetical protein